MLVATLALALAGPPQDLTAEVQQARQTLQACEDRGCDPSKGARAAWLVALGTYLDTGEALGELSATVRQLSPDLFADLPEVLQQAATEAASWASPPPKPAFVPAPGTAAAIAVGEDLTASAQQYAQYAVAQKLTWGPTLVSAELTSAMRQGTQQCFIPLKGALWTTLSQLVPEANDLYVALPSDATRQTQFWRLNRRHERLDKVFSDQRVPVPERSGHTQVLLVPQDDSTPLSPNRVPRYSSGSFTVEALPPDPRLANQLLEHPNECVAELTEEGRNRLAALAANYKGSSLIVVTGFSRRQVFAWEWDPESRTASKVHGF